MMIFILFWIFMTISKTSTYSLLTGPFDHNLTSINERNEIKDIDVLRQIINQETVIPLTLEKEVRAVMDDVNSVKRIMRSTETIISTFMQTLETLKEESQENKKILMNCQNRIQNIVQRYEIRNTNETESHKQLNSSELRTTLKGFKRNADCMDLYMNGHTQSGVYEINSLDKDSQINVYCDMVTEGGGWTAIQKRTSGSVSFNKTWEEYKKGFGNPDDSYWIGNDMIHHLSKGRNPSLYISIRLQNDTKLYEIYDKFSISDESDNYRLFLGGPATGTLGDSMLYTTYCSNSHSGQYFSTLDMDNEKRRVGSCAEEFGSKGGWWFNWCHDAFLNGPWTPEYWARPWYPTIHDGREIEETFMMIRPH